VRGLFSPYQVRTPYNLHGTSQPRVTLVDLRNPVVPQPALTRKPPVRQALPVPESILFVTLSQDLVRARAALTDDPALDCSGDGTQIRSQ
jgi:hypothetical protein